MAARNWAPRTSPIPVKLVMMAASCWVWKLAATLRSTSARCRSSSSMVWASRATRDRGCRFARKLSGLLAGGFGGGGGEPSGMADSAPFQPAQEPGGTQPTDCRRGLKASDQHQRAVTSEVKNPFQRGKDAE